MSQARMMTNAVTLRRVDALGKELESQVILDPRERSLHATLRAVEAARGKVRAQPGSTYLRALLSVLVGEYGFVLPAKEFEVNVFPEGVLNPRPADDPAWNWKGLAS